MSTCAGSLPTPNYWPQCAPYDEKGLVLRQNASKYGQEAEKRDTQAEFVRHILELGRRSP